MVKTRSLAVTGKTVRSKAIPGLRSNRFRNLCHVHHSAGEQHDRGGIAGIGEDLSQAGKQPEQGGQQQGCAVALECIQAVQEFPSEDSPEPSAAKQR